MKLRAGYLENADVLILLTPIADQILDERVHAYCHIQPCVYSIYKIDNPQAVDKTLSKQLLVRRLRVIFGVEYLWQ